MIPVGRNQRNREVESEDKLMERKGSPDHQDMPDKIVCRAVQKKNEQSLPLVKELSRTRRVISDWQSDDLHNRRLAEELRLENSQ
jgi:hypothetical protein